MTADLFVRAEPIVAEAMTRSGHARAEWLDVACDGDVALRGEVESLLAFEGPSAAFLERPALEDAARQMGDELDPAALVGQQIGDYRVDALVGVGGMADVYRVRNLPLARDEALKVLVPSPLVRAADRARVETEARAASRLNHPNIVTIFAVGEAEGVHFIAMELVDGQTLRQRLADGPLEVPVVADVAVQLSEALAAAHAAGIVHRDLKPENIKITADGRVKVLDFGIAGGALADPAGADLVAGTAGYMAPEQAAGQPARPASDQFSFGVILYEMLTGQPPFVAATREATVTAVGSVEHRPIAGLDPGIAGVLRRCLAKSPEERFASSADLAAACRAWRVRLERRGVTRRRVLQATAASLAVISAGIGAWRLGPWSVQPRRLAVLPFRNRSADRESDYLAAGLTATLIERLGVMPALTVLPRSLVANFAASDESPGNLGSRLSADAVLSGDITRAVDRLHVTAQLLDVASGRTLWSASYEQPANGLLFVEEQIAQAIVDDGVRLRLNAKQRQRLVRHETADPQVFDAYLRAVYLCEQETEAAYLEARAVLGPALERDPHFAPGHVQMAATYAVMAVDGLQRPTEAWPRSSRHVRLALEATPDAADAHASAASHEFFFNWNWEAAEAEWREALRFGGADLHPDLYASRALQRAAVGRLDEALELARRARRLDPVTSMFAVREADFLLLTGDATGAADIYEAVVGESPGDVRALFGLSDACRTLGRLDDAVASRRRAHLVLGEHDVLAGDRLDDAADELRRLDRAGAVAQLAAFDERAAAGSYVSPLDVARQFARLGNVESAAARFDAAMADRAPGLTMLDVDRAWDPMRADPRFLALRLRVGLPRAPSGAIR